MFINSITTNPRKKLDQLIENLKLTYGFDVTKIKPQNLLAYSNKYEAIKNRIIAESAYNSYHADPDYAKAVLITETIKLLIEVAPKRKKQKVKESQINEDNMKYKTGDRVHYKGEECDVVEFTKGPMIGLKINGKTSMVNVKDVKPCVKESFLNEEENLDQAQTLLAAKDLSDRLQKMAETAAKMAVDDLMPLVDTMKSQFGQESAKGFNDVVKQNLQSVLDTIIKAKDETDNAVLSLQSGRTPSSTSDISNHRNDKFDREDFGDSDDGADDEFAATPSASGPPNEPLGRSKKDIAEGKIPPQFLANIKKMKAKSKGKKVEEVKKKCMDCKKGVYEQKGKKMMCNECGNTIVAEDIQTIGDATGPSGPANTQPNTDDYSTADLQNALNTGKTSDGKPVDRTAAQNVINARKNSTMSESLTKKMSVGEIIADFEKSTDPKFKGKSKEERKKMALGAYYGMHPEESKTEESQLAKTDRLLENLTARYNKLKEAFENHKKTFKKQVTEGRQLDILNVGYGLEGDAIREKIRNVVTSIKETRIAKAKIIESIEFKKQTIADAKQEMSKFTKQIGSNPYGVVAFDSKNNKITRFFESENKRAMWLEFQKDKLVEHRLINPEMIQKAKSYLGKKVR
jgi:ribosomal protein S27E